MKRNLLQGIIIMLLAITTIAAKAQNEPIVTMTTEMTVGYTFKFNVKASENVTTVKVDFGDGTLVEKTVYKNSSKRITGKLQGSEVKIYGASDCLTYLSCQNIKLTSLDVSKNTALTQLLCYENKLTSLDVSNNTALTVLTCHSNSLTCLDVSKNIALTKLKCKSNKLTKLNVSKNELLKELYCGLNNLTELDISKNTALTALHCYCNSLTNLDLSKNTALTELHCGFNKLTSLDMSKNTALARLNCYFNELTSLDVSKNTALTALNCNSNKLTSLDVSKNTALTYLRCESNELTNLDVSKNTTLECLYCYSNKLTSLDVSKNAVFDDLYCYSNNLKLSGLPIKSIDTYKYSPQNEVVIAGNAAIFEKIDLSSEYKIGGEETIYKWYTLSGNELKKDEDYTIKKGVTHFINVQKEKVYCQMTNSKFPNLTLKTTLIKIDLGDPIITMTTTMAKGSSFSFKVRANQIYTYLKVDYGDGVLVKETVGDTISFSPVTEISRELQGIALKIYGSPDRLTYLDFSSNNLTSLDVSKNTALTYLRCDNNNLAFSELPLKAISTYRYFPQSEVKIAEKVALNGKIDLSSEYMIDGVKTTYRWYTSSGTELTEGIDYSIENGVTSFLKIQSEKVYCGMTNAKFPDLTLKTTNVAITNSVTESMLKNTLKEGEATLDIANAEKQNVVIYPNPVSTQLTVKARTAIKKLQIISATGAVVYSQIVNSTEASVETSAFAPGIYILKLETEKGAVIRRFVKR